jgi:hypothetical protein
MQEAAVLARGVQIIHQNAHPHAAIRRKTNMVQEQR